MRYLQYTSRQPGNEIWLVNMAQWLPQKFWCKPQNGELVQKSWILEIAENHVRAHFHMWSQN